MKKLWSLFGLLGLMFVLLNSCSKDKGPADSDVFIGTYKGKIGYKSDTEDKSSSVGSVTVAKVNNSYSFAFSDGIPNITDIRLEKENDEFHINVGGNATSYIRINSGKLVMLYIKDGRTWTANCTR